MRRSNGAPSRGARSEAWQREILRAFAIPHRSGYRICMRCTAGEARTIPVPKADYATNVIRTLLTTIPDNPHCGAPRRARGSHFAIVTIEHSDPLHADRVRMTRSARFLAEPLDGVTWPTELALAMHMHARGEDLNLNKTRGSP